MGLGPPHTYLLLRGRIEKPAASHTLPAVELYAGKVKDPNRLLSSTVVDPAHVRPQDWPPPPNGSVRSGAEGPVQVSLGLQLTSFNSGYTESQLIL